MEGLDGRRSDAAPRRGSVAGDLMRPLGGAQSAAGSGHHGGSRRPAAGGAARLGCGGPAVPPLARHRRWKLRQLLVATARAEPTGLSFSFRWRTLLPVVAALEGIHAGAARGSRSPCIILIFGVQVFGRKFS